MNEEEIIKEFKDLIYNPDYDEILLRCEDGFTGWHELFKNVLDLYNKVKEENKKLLTELQENKCIEDIFKPLYIPKSKVKELREIDNIDLLQTKLKQLLEEGE